MTDHDDLSMNRFPEDEKNLEHEIRAMLEYETNKPEEFRDYESIDLLLRKLVKLQKLDERTQRRTQAGIHVVQSAIQNQYKKQPSRKLRCVVLAACAVLILVPNIWSYTVYGMNALKLSYSFVKGGMVIDFQTHDPEKDDVCGDMRKICEENGIDALLPTYIPSGFYHTEIFGKVSSNDKYTLIGFHFKDQNDRKIIYKIICFNSKEDAMPYGMPSDDWNVTEQVYQDTTVAVSTEDQQYRAAFMIDSIQYSLSTYDLDYEEGSKILQSILSKKQGNDMPDAIH